MTLGWVWCQNHEIIAIGHQFSILDIKSIYIRFSHVGYLHVCNYNQLWLNNKLNLNSILCNYDHNATFEVHVLKESKKIYI